MGVGVQKSEQVSPELLEAISVVVKKAYEEVRTEDARAEKKKALYNTRKLMEKYVDLKKYINTAISEEQEVYESEYNAFKGENVKLKSVKRAKMVTAIMVLNIDRAMEELEAESIKDGTLYKFEAFKMHYIDGMTFEEIADCLNCGKNSPSNWSKAILKRMSVKLFGIDGI